MKNNDNASRSDKRTILNASAVTFLILALIEFLPLGIPFKMVFPMVSLFVFGFFLQSWPIIVAAFFSAVGDTFGYLDNMPPQIGAFAVAQCFYIGYFLSRGLKMKKQGGVKGIWFAFCTLLAVGVYYICCEKVIPFAPEGVIRIGFYVYGGLVITMMWSALMQKDWMWGIGGVLFVFSDAIIAINAFVTPVPHEGFIIMSTYYAAQILIFLRCALEKDPSLLPVKK